MTDGRAALDVLAGWLRARYGGSRVLGVGHRVVHGGAKYAGPCVVTPEVLDDLRALIPLAPLHQPYNLAAIEAVSERLPGVPQVACFDTSFHRGQPAVAELVPLPEGHPRHRRAALRLPRALLRVHRVGAARGRAGDRRRPRDRRPPRQRRQPLRAERGGRAWTARSASPRSTGSAWARGRGRSIRA